MNNNPQLDSAENNRCVAVILGFFSAGVSLVFWISPKASESKEAFFGVAISCSTITLFAALAVIYYHCKLLRARRLIFNLPLYAASTVVEDTPSQILNSRLQVLAI